MYPARLQSNRLPPLTCFLHRLRTATELAASRWVAMVLLPALVGDSEYAPFLSYLSYFQLFHWEGSGQWLPCVESCWAAGGGAVLQVAWFSCTASGQMWRDWKHGKAVSPSSGTFPLSGGCSARSGDCSFIAFATRQEELKQYCFSVVH